MELVKSNLSHLLQNHKNLTRQHLKMDLYIHLNRFIYWKPKGSFKLILQKDCFCYIESLQNLRKYINVPVYTYIRYVTSHVVLFAILQRSAVDALFAAESSSGSCLRHLVSVNRYSSSASGSGTTTLLQRKLERTSLIARERWVLAHTRFAHVTIVKDNPDSLQSRYTSPLID